MQSNDSQLTFCRRTVAIALCTLINMMDGFDILAAAFTGPAIASDWLLHPRQLGLLFSSALTGMICGALLVSPLADYWGRRRTVLLSLVLVTTGMVASGAADSLLPLVAARVLTGVGVGAMMPAINSVVAELASGRRRDFAVSIQAMGFPLGGALGALGLYLTPEAPWRHVFLAGGAISLLLMVPVLMWMPESSQISVERSRLMPRARRLWRDFGGPSLLIWSSFFLLMFTFYFFANWTPKLLTDYGLGTSVGVSGAVLMNIGGVIGDAAFVLLMLRWPARHVGPVFMALSFVTAVTFAFIPLRLDALLPAALLLGFLLFGSMSSLYAIVPSLYPDALRVTGSGIALGLGRIGAAIGPYVGGILISLAWSRSAYLTVMAFPLLACAGLTFLLASQSRAAPRE